MTDTKLEQQRMATLLQSPELYHECKQFSDSSWTLDGNKWIWKKLNEHYSVYNNLPTINILKDYAADYQSKDPVTISAVNVLLEYYVNQSPQDNTYFKDTLLANAKDTQIRESLLPLITNKDWQGVKDVIEQANKQTSKLPSRLDLKTLMTKPSNDNQCLLNEWAFERQAMLAIVAPTGIGKSVLTMQLATHFAAGKSVIGFYPKKPYKVLVIQNEDSDNDIAIMRDGSISQLNDNEKDLAYENLVFIRLRGSAGDTFLAALESYCREFQPDIVFVNPLLKYYGGDPLNTKEVSTFLNKLEPILERYNCGLVLIHHTVKQSKTSRMNQVDSSYSGFGSSAWSNSVRDTIEIRSSTIEGYYKLLAGKRAGKWGWKELYIQRSENPLLPYWKEVIDSDIKYRLSNAKPSAVSENKDSIYGIIQPLPIVMTINEMVEQTGISERTIRTHIKELMTTNKVAATDDRVKKYYRIVTTTTNN